jgi:hypothetical protein
VAEIIRDRAISQAPANALILPDPKKGKRFILRLIKHIVTGQWGKIRILPLPRQSGAECLVLTKSK